MLKTRQPKVGMNLIKGSQDLPKSGSGEQFSLSRSTRNRHRIEFSLYIVYKCWEETDPAFGVQGKNGEGRNIGVTGLVKLWNLHRQKQVHQVC